MRYALRAINERVTHKILPDATAEILEEFVRFRRGDQEWTTAAGVDDDVAIQPGYVEPEHLLRGPAQAEATPQATRAPALPVGCVA